MQFTTSAIAVSSRAHTTLFWNLLHKLLYKAEELKIYKNIFQTEQAFIDLTKTLKEKYLSVNGHLMKEFGRLLLKAHELCFKHQVNFDDYMDTYDSYCDTNPNSEICKKSDEQMKVIVLSLFEELLIKASDDSVEFICEDFFETGELLDSCNEDYMTLLPEDYLTLKEH